MLVSIDLQVTKAVSQVPEPISITRAPSVFVSTGLHCYRSAFCALEHQSASVRIHICYQRVVYVPEHQTTSDRTHICSGAHSMLSASRTPKSVC